MRPIPADGNLDDGDILPRVSLVLDAVLELDAVIACHLVAVGLDVAHHLGKRLRECVVRPDMLQTDSHRHLWQPLELDDVGVLIHTIDLQAVLDVDVLILVLPLMLHHEAVDRLSGAYQYSSSFRKRSEALYTVSAASSLSDWPFI